MGPRVPLTIVVGTIQGWPETRANVASFRVAAEAVGGELIVADGSGRPAPAPDEIGAQTIWLSEPGISVFQLRRLAYQRARGAIVAITEDHCFVADDWGRRILQAHAEHPEASVIGGAVEMVEVNPPLLPSMMHLGLKGRWSLVLFTDNPFSRSGSRRTPSPRGSRTMSRRFAPPSSARRATGTSWPSKVRCAEHSAMG